jgi:alkanesulfonate monooxygenase SsuD/methylene tetrahydromethanopterin reductase-like flavin-dependent oxidoreductase (luciferase family)
MKIGMTLPTMVGGLQRRHFLEWSRRVDTAPFSSLAAGERIAFPNQEIMVTMAAAAALTERVRLVFTVVVLPMHSPVLMAKQLATMDVLSAGRVSVGIGVGGREEDYRAVGAPFERRAKRMVDHLRTMRRVWAGESPGEGIAPVGPPPVQPDGPEILAGSLMPDAIRRAARWSDGLCGFSFGPSPDEVSMAFDVARQAWRDAGRDKPPRLITSCWFSLGPDGPATMDAYARRYLGFFGDDVAASLATQCTTTSAAALKDVVRRIADAGADELILVPTVADPDEVDRVADLVF